MRKQDENRIITSGCGSSQGISRLDQNKKQRQQIIIRYSNNSARRSCSTKTL